MISQTAEYAMRAVAHLAKNFDAPCTTQNIATATCVPSDYLSKVLKELARAGLVKSQRGLYGGFRLLRPPDELTVYEVLQAVNPLQRIHECPLGLTEHSGTLCPLHRLLDDAMGQIEDAFRRATIGELLASSDHDSALCEPLGRNVPLRVDGKKKKAAGRKRRTRQSAK